MGIITPWLATTSWNQCPATSAASGAYSAAIGYNYTECFTRCDLYVGVTGSCGDLLTETYILCTVRAVNLIIPIIVDTATDPYKLLCNDLLVLREVIRQLIAVRYMWWRCDYMRCITIEHDDSVTDILQVITTSLYVSLWECHSSPMIYTSSGSGGNFSFSFNFVLVVGKDPAACTATYYYEGHYS